MPRFSLLPGPANRGPIKATMRFSRDSIVPSRPPKSITKQTLEIDDMPNHKGSSSVASSSGRVGFHRVSPFSEISSLPATANRSSPFREGDAESSRMCNERIL